MSRITDVAKNSVFDVSEYVFTIQTATYVHNWVEHILFQNYPNPFNPSMVIRYGIPERSQVSLTVYNTLGQKVAVLINEVQEASFYEVTFDAAHLPSGTCIYHLQAGENVESRKLLYLI